MHGTVYAKRETAERFAEIRTQQKNRPYVALEWHGGFYVVDKAEADSIQAKREADAKKPDHQKIQEAADARLMTCLLPIIMRLNQHGPAGRVV